MEARSQKASLDYAMYTAKVVAEKRANPSGDDLMSLLSTAEIDGYKLDDEALVHESMLILIGGDETTRHVITGGMPKGVVHGLEVVEVNHQGTHHEASAAAARRGACKPRI